MTVPTRIYLTGFMGSGKSALGPRLAERLGHDFVDLDEHIEREAGCTIQTLFATRGEDGFRRLETGALHAVSDRERVVVALGGGAVTRQGAMRLVRASGCLVYLRMTPSRLAERLAGQTASRPLLHEQGRPLAGDALRIRIATLLAPRASFYEQADITLDADTETVDLLVSRATEALERYGARTPYARRNERR